MTLELIDTHCHLNHEEFSPDWAEVYHRAEWNAAASEEIAALFAAHPGKMTAYGEIGLDYHWDTVPRARQIEVFAAQIAFALSLRPEAPLPLIIHNRDALADVLAVLKASQTPAPIIMHCFTGGTETARQCLDAGCYLGIGGVATFKKSDAVRAAMSRRTCPRLPRLLLPQNRLR